MTQVNDNTFKLRRATLGDAADLAKVALMASEGLSRDTWNELREGAESALDVGTRRAARTSGDFSYLNAIVAEREGQIVGAVVSYHLTETPADETVPNTFRSLDALESQVEGSWYINMLATDQANRRKGVASSLILEVERLAKQKGASQISLIVRDKNPARDFYRGLGFCEVSRAPMVHGETPLEGRDWVLMIKPVKHS